MATDPPSKPDPHSKPDPTSNPWNPYEHNHDHGSHGHHHDHDHDHDHDHHHDDEVLDPAQRSLSDALKVSFGLLKVLMVLLMIAYLFSGTFTVNEQQVAVRLAFGKIVGDSEASQRVLKPGGPYFSLPYPINDVVYIETTPRVIHLEEDFWFEIDQSMAGQTFEEMASRIGPLNPERDGSLLTGDASIAHARWTVFYKVDETRVPDYLRNVADAEKAAELVSDATQQGIVFAVAQVTADRLNKGMTDANLAVARKRAQATLNAVGSGLEITDLKQTVTVFPGSVREAFQAVVNAETEKAKLIEEARGARARLLGEAAGEAAEALSELVAAYEVASESDDQAKLDVLDKTFDRIFEDLSVSDPRDTSGEGLAIPIGGHIAVLMNEAVATRTRIVEQVRADAEYFERLLPQYRQNQRIVKNRIWQNAREDILTGDNVEAFYAPDVALYLETNRDPRVAKQRVERQIRKEANERRQQQQN